MRTADKMKIMWVLIFGVICLILQTPAIAAGSLTDVSVTPEITNVAGSYTSMNVAFTVESAIPVDGKIKIVFEVVGGDSITCYNNSVVFSNDTGTLDGGFTVEWPDVATDSHNSIVIQRDGTGSVTNAGAVVNLSFGNVLLPAIPGSYPVTTVETRDSGTIDLATNAATVHVFASVGIASFTFDSVGNQIAGSPFNISISEAKDSNGLAANGVIQISDDTNAGTAPSGQEPVFRDVTVINGIGEAEQVLFQANTGVQLHAQVVGGISHQSAPFDVAPSNNVATVVIYDQLTGDIPGATEADDYGVDSGKFITVHALGWDTFENYVGATAVDWDVSGNIGTLSPASGESTTLTAGAVNVGTIQAIIGGVVKDETGQITVSASSSTITNINIQDSPYASGSRMNLAIDMTTDDELKLYAVGYDGSGNYVGLVSDAVWISSGDLNPAVSEIGASILFEPDSITTGVNNYIQAGRADLVDDYTGRINVTVGVLHHMEMQTWVGGSMTDSINTDQVMALLAIGYDANGNMIPDGGQGNPKQNAKWEFSSGSDKGDLTPVSPTAAYEGALTPKIAGNCIIRATNVNNPAIWVDSPLISIFAGSVARLVLMDQAGSSGQPIGDISLRADESLRIWAGAVDIFGNFISQATPPWTYEDITLTNVAEISTNGEYADINPKLAGGQFRVIVSHATFVDDSTGIISVTPGVKHNLKILKGGSGTLGGVLNDTTLSVDTDMLVHAASYDLDGNYIGDEILNIVDDWNVIGGIGRLEQGGNAISVRFVPTKIGTGLIKVEQSGIQIGYSGSITVESGQVTSFLVRSGPDGSGDDVSSLNMTTDDVANLYAAGYDAGGNYIEDVVVDWTSSGWVTDIPYSTTDTFLEFNPTKTGSDSIFVAHATTGVMDTVIVNQVLPGEPYGDGGLITLTPDRQQIPADGVTTVLITSNEIIDRDGNLVSEGVHFTVRATLGEIVTADLDTTVADTQVAVNGAGKIQFEFKASSGGGTANIYANSLSAQGVTTVNISNVEIVSVSTEKNTVSLGQDSISVRMLVENLGNQLIEITQAELNFSDKGGFDRKSDYTITPPLILPQIPAGATEFLDFGVRVHVDAITDTVIIDGELNTDIAGIQVAQATEPDSWWVQAPGAIEVLRVEALEDTVTQGMSDLDVWMRIRNNSGEFGATVKVDSLKPTFWLGSQNVTDQYISTPIWIDTDTLAGQEEAVVNFKLNVNSGAMEGNLRIDAAVYGHDINSDSLVQDIYADSTDNWLVEQAAAIQLVSLGLSQSKVTHYQSQDWYTVLRVRNNGVNTVELDAAALKFFSLNEDITAQYVVVSPDTFMNGNTYIEAGDEEELWVTVDSTGGRLGTVTVRADVEFHDAGASGVSLMDRRETLVLVQEVADVAIYGVGLSQPEVTRGQEHDWLVKVAVANSGGSTVEIDYTKTNLKFATGSDFTVLSPVFQDGGGDYLAEGAADTLVFVVDKTGASHGNSNITVNLVMSEVNSGREISLVDNSTDILIQTKPKISIKTLTNEAINAPDVNKNQQFNIGVVLHNSGGGAADEADSVKVELRSNQQPGQVWTKTAHDVYYGSPQKVVFTVNAADTVGLVETFVANIVEAREGNTGDLFTPDTPVWNTTEVNLKRPSSLEVLAIEMPDTVQARQYNPWEIKLRVRNNGEANVKIDTPSADDIQFYVDDVRQTDFIIEPPENLGGGGLLLGPVAPDYLTYTVTQTGARYGQVHVNLQIAATDENDSENAFQVDIVDSLEVSASAKIKIVSMEPQCYVYRNIGQVNLGQAFQIGVTVENRGAEQADSIFVVMNASDTSVVSYTDTLMIEALGIEESTVIMFPVTAQKITDEVQFDAKVIRAKGHVSGLDVPVEGMSSSNGFVRIHEASALHFDVDTESGLRAFARGQSFKIMAAISRSGTSSLDNSGAMTITVPDGYTLVSPQSVSFSLPDGINVSQVYWDLQAPDVPKAPSAFTVTMTPRPNDRNLSAPVSVDNLQHSLSVETMTSSMNITSIQILEPEGAKDGTISTDQWFRIQATASFSENVRDHWAVLNLPVTDVSNSYAITSVDSTIHSTSGVWIWQVNAPSLPLSAKPFSVTVFGTEKTENDVSNTNAITVSTVRKTSLYVELSSGAGNPAGGLELSVGQEFELKVLVRNKGEANAKGLGWVTLDLGATGIVTTNPVRQPYSVNDYVSWTLSAPNNPSPQQYLSVQIESIPQDENRTDTAYFENETLQLVAVKTMDQGRITQNILAIESPLGAQDYIVSTGQSFTLRSEISWERLVGVSAQILYPSSFVCSEPIQRPENYESTHGSAVVTFNLTALTSPVTNESVRVIVTGTDENDATRTLADTTSTVRMTIVEAAQAVVRAETDVQNNVVSVGQRFHVKGWLQNAGQAKLTGTYTAELSSESTSYVVLSQIVQTRTSADTIAWTVQAPYTAISGQSLRVKVTQWPNDENKNAAPIITNSTVTIPIVTEEKEVIISQHNHAAPRSLTKGANGVPLLGFVLRNNGNISSNPLLLRGIQVKLLDRNGEPIESPSAAIDRLFAFRAGNPDHLFGEIHFGGLNKQTVGNSGKYGWDLNFTKTDTIFPTMPDTIMLGVDVAENATILDFQVAVDTVAAFDLVDMYSGFRPVFKGLDGEEIEVIAYDSGISVVIEEDFEVAFLNYPNPFGRSGREQTKFVYYLEQDTDVELQLFTLTGALVWSQKFSAVDPEGLKGMHEDGYYGSGGEGGPAIWWDGRNVNGDRVMNGVYIAVLTTGDGQQTTTKVAVLK